MQVSKKYESFKGAVFFSFLEIFLSFLVAIAFLGYFVVSLMSFNRDAPFTRTVKDL